MAVVSAVPYENHTDNHTSTSSVNFYGLDALPDAHLMAVFPGQPE